MELQDEIAYVRQRLKELENRRVAAKDEAEKDRLTLAIQNLESYHNNFLRDE